MLVCCLAVRTELSSTCPEVIKLEFILKLKIKRNDWLLAGHGSASSHSLRFILSFRLNSSFITSGPGPYLESTKDCFDLDYDTLSQHANGVSLAGR